MGVMMPDHEPSARAPHARLRLLKRLRRQLLVAGTSLAMLFQATAFGAEMVARPGTAGSGSLPSVLRGLSSAEGRAEDALGPLNETRRLMAGGGMADAVKAVAHLGDAVVPSPDQVGAPVGGRAPDLSDVPRQIRKEVAILLNAIGIAKTLTDNAIAEAELAAESNRSRSQDANGWEALNLFLYRRGVLPHKHLMPPWPSEPDGVRIDREIALAAAAVVASSIDHTLTRLAAHAGSLPRRSSSDRGAPPSCDVVDQLPTLCVGNTGKNSYRKDAELLIDLGGNDTYSNSAGGADPVVGNGLSVSVNLDLDGNDRYKAHLPLPSGARVAHGAAADGGVGFLVDVDGKDAYVIDARPSIPSPKSLGTVGQGAAYVSGFGLLADHAGNDKYRLTSRSPDGSMGSLGAGSGAGSAAGVLIDADGDDSYRAVSDPITLRHDRGFDSTSSAAVAGFGAGVLGGVGLLADHGGDDTMALAVTKKLRVGKDTVFQGAGTSAAGFGASAGVGSAGVILLGSGRTKASVSSKASMHGVEIDEGVGASAFAFGAGVTGYGGLYDDGGNDQYVIKAAATGLGQSLAGGTAAGMGTGVIGVGVLQDKGGDDRYVSSAAADGFAGAGAASVVEGAGFGLVANEGVGVLHDGDGDDFFNSESQGHIDIYLTRFQGLPWADGAALSAAQGVGAAGTGDFRNKEGADSYTSFNRFTLGNPARNFVSNPDKDELNAFSFVQASALGGIAFMYDVDRGSRDYFKAVPANPACLGTRGTSTWRDCGLIYGEGSVRDLP